MISQSDNSNQIFRCELDNAKILLNLLKSVNLTENVTIFLSTEGIHFVVEKNKSFQVTAFLNKELFSGFKFDHEEVSFRVDIKVFIDSLTSMLATENSKDSQEDKDSIGTNSHDDTNVSIALIYQDYGHPLIIVLEDEISLTECCISTQDANDIVVFETNDDTMVGKVIIDSDCLKEILAELNNGSDQILMEIDTNFGLIFKTSGANVTSTKRISKDSSKIDFDFKKSFSSFYSMQYIKFCVKALGQSTKTSIKLDNSGLLKIDYMMSLYKEIKCVVESYCLPNVDLNN